MTDGTRDMSAEDRDRVVVKCSVPDAGTTRFEAKRQEPVTMVIFGASGDLTERKLVPALYKLFVEGGLPDPFVIFGSSLLDMTNESFRDKMEKAVPRYCELDRDKWRVFASRMFYQKIDYRDPSTYANLGDVLGGHISCNRLVMGIQPEEKITLTFQTKTPGPGIGLRSVTMDFDYLQGYSGPALEAYEKVLLDVIDGEQMLFWRQDGLELTWAFLTPVLSHCESCEDRASRLLTYPSGSRGPEAVSDVLKRHGKEWSDE